MDGGLRWLEVQGILQRVQTRALLRKGFNRRVVNTSAGATSTWQIQGTGKLPPIVVQHGLSSSGGDMTRLLVRLVRHFSAVYAPDFLGHGFSQQIPGGAGAEQVEQAYRETLDAILHEPVLFFGNSLGGFAGLKLAISEPERLRGLMACSPGGAGGQTAEELAVFYEQFRMDSYQKAVEFVQNIHARSAWYHSLMVPGVYLRLRNPTVVRMLAESGPEDMLKAEELGAMTVPIALLWGQEEALMPDSHREFFVGSVPKDSSIIEPSGFSHCPHLEEPKNLSRVIVRWAESLGD